MKNEIYNSSTQPFEIRKLKILGTLESLPKNLSNFFIALKMSNQKKEQKVEIPMELYISQTALEKEFSWITQVIEQEKGDVIKINLCSTVFKRKGCGFESEALSSLPLLHFELGRKKVYVVIADINKITKEQTAALEEICPWGSAFLDCILL